MYFLLLEVKANVAHRIDYKWPKSFILGAYARYTRTYLHWRDMERLGPLSAGRKLGHAKCP